MVCIHEGVVWCNAIQHLPALHAWLDEFSKPDQHGGWFGHFLLYCWKGQWSVFLREHFFLEIIHVVAEPEHVNLTMFSF